MAKRWHRYFGFANDSKTLAAFKSLGVPHGIKSFSWGVARSNDWLVGSGETAVTYQVEFRELKSDLDHFLTVVLDDDILESMLDGLRDDPDGPRVDFRKMFDEHFTNEVVVIVSPDQHSDRVMIAFPLHDPKSVTQALIRMMNVEPGAVKTDLDGKLWITPSKQVVSVADDYLLVGDDQMVRRAISRIP